MEQINDFVDNFDNCFTDVTSDFYFNEEGNDMTDGFDLKEAIIYSVILENRII